LDTRSTSGTRRARDALAAGLALVAEPLASFVARLAPRGDAAAAATR
jgi:hypothetical protein